VDCRIVEEKLFEFEFGKPELYVFYFKFSIKVVIGASSVLCLSVSIIFDYNIIIWNYCLFGFACAVTPMLKRTVDDQENISDFDDDIAAEVAAAMATAKTPVLVTQEGAVTMSSEWAPRHSGVPDFSPPPPVLQKRNSTSTNSYSPVQGVDNLSNQYTTHTANNDSDLSISKIGIICAIVGLCVLGLSVLMVFVLKNIINDTDVFSNYKG